MSGIIAVAVAALIALMWETAIAPAIDTLDYNVRQTLKANQQLLDGYDTARELQDGLSELEDARDYGRMFNQLLIWVFAPIGIVGAGIITAKEGG